MPDSPSCACQTVKYAPEDVMTTHPLKPDEVTKGSVDTWKCPLCKREFLPKSVGDSLAILAKDSSSSLALAQNAADGAIRTIIDIQKALTMAGAPAYQEEAPSPAANVKMRLAWLIAQFEKLFINHTRKQGCGHPESWNYAAEDGKTGETAFWCVGCQRDEASRLYVEAVSDDARKNKKSDSDLSKLFQGNQVIVKLNALVEETRADAIIAQEVARECARIIVREAGASVSVAGRNAPMDSFASIADLPGLVEDVMDSFKRNEEAKLGKILSPVKVLLEEIESDEGAEVDQGSALHLRLKDVVKELDPEDKIKASNPFH